MITRDTRLTFFILIVALILCLVLPPVMANPHPHDDDGDDGGIVITGSDINVTGGDLTGGDLIGGDTIVSTGGNRALAIANSLGDVDFTGICQGSSQFGTPIFSKQRIQRDETCLGFAFLKIGAYTLAQMHFCMDKETLAQYTSVVSCETEHNFKPDDHDVHTRSEEFERAYAVQEEEIEYLQEEQASLVGRVDDLTMLLELSSTAAVAAPTPVYIQQEPEPRYTEEDAAYILGLYSKGGDEDD